ncbi:PilN family type IVB pilus formation outer membrane protein [Salmonella enterica subsp. enterica]|jgi:type IVB pilus formation R64 PilN family outer membrane protein|uniref:PilN family type IVB pilus formation outer membrane protein n=1 Tax=Salmonella enterica TaxID=28901 RepID=A0A760JLM8_SALER|nr:PilN family type IVB pilus formation outer membrane protein [Salmonella enterica subsp. enterica serovar Oranienburg]EAB6471587.1 PilN family type IVB pilus formation outer membrane protein [Salmonella enterica subsp. enterica]EBS5920225.1 PilN family type IVB pilus formation outer membrane protein [Salmonella enterica subsp. enterica serovar Bispebjerg]ECA1876167.1 PilN family type IVB pilus formation outer membrane protein [Salmonella enterica subsp. enterica serovar Napoli]ECM3601009.1 Pi
MMRKTLSALAILSLLSGCSTLDRIDAVGKQARDDEKITSQHLQKMKSGEVVRELPSQWINPIPLNARGNDRERLPSCLIQINRPGVISVNDISALITRTCHLTVVLTPDARQVTQASGPTEQIKGPLPAPDANGMLPLAQMGNTVATPVPRAGSEATLRGVYWKGALDGFLDNITTRLGLSWRYEEGRIVIYYLDTRNFPVLFMDSQAGFTSKTVSGTTSSTGSSGGGSSGGISGDSNTSQSTDMAIKSNLYGDVSATVKAMLTPGVGRMNLSAGVLTVTDTSRVLSQIGRYIDDRNRELNRQVVLNVQIYSVESRRSDQLGIDWDAVLSLSSVKATFTNAFTNANDAIATGGAMIVDGKGAGTKALVKALSEQGNVSVITQSSSLTTNLSAVPIQIALQQDYISDVTSEQTANVGSSVSSTRSTITTGFNMTVLPYLMPASSSMQLQFSVNMSDDPTMRTVPQGEKSSVELMKTRLKTFTQRVNMKSGQTLILSGYEQLNNTADHQGVGSPRFFGMGGGSSGSENRTQLVMFVTPIIQG